MNNQFTLRRAIDTDHVALSQINQRTFRETYVDGVIDIEYEHVLGPYSRSTMSPEIYTNQIADPQQATWIVEDKTTAEIVAFANAGPCTLTHPDIRANEDGELCRLHVRRDRQGNKLGQWLMNEALSWLEDRFPGRPVWVRVWANNMKALKFYQQYNFKKVADCYSKLGKYQYDDFIMRRDSCPS